MAKVAVLAAGRATHVETGGHDEDVDGSELGRGALDERAHLCLVADVDARRDGRAARLGGDGLILPRHVRGDDDGRAAGGVLERDLAAEAAAAARDERDLAGELAYRHAWTSSSSGRRLARASHASDGRRSGRRGRAG